MQRPFVLAIALLTLSLVAAPALAQGPPPPPPLVPLPPPPQPAGNPTTDSKANLGKTLFWDEQLSGTRTMACGSCHVATGGGADPRTVMGSAHTTNPGPDGVYGTADDIASSPGVVLNGTGGAFQWSGTFGLGTQVTPRTSMSMINAAYAPENFWDGRAGGTFVDPTSGDTVLTAGGALENQVLGPPLSTVEMGSVGRTWSDVASRLGAVTPLALSPSVPGALSQWIGGRGYAQLFQEAFGTAEVSVSRIAMAIAAYERTLFSTRAPIDSVIAGTATLSGDEAAGFRLFGALTCAGCHGSALFSDNVYHYDGVRPASDDSGRAVVTHAASDLGAFKTPSLRNVALRPVFMHDGRFGTLAEVVDFYDRGGDFSAPDKSPAVHPLGLTAQQKAQLVAFLGRPLTDPRVAAGSAPFDRPALYTESSWVPEELTGGVSGSAGSPPQPVALEPALIGNDRFTIGVDNAPGGAAAVLVVDSAVPPASSGIPAIGSFARVSVTLEGSGVSGGYGSATLAIPNDAALKGTTLYARWYVTDAGASGGVAASAPVRIAVFGPYGTGAATGVAAGAPANRVMHLYASQPNPFPVSTTVRFDLYRNEDVHLAVYDVTGRRVRTLMDRPGLPAGAYATPWDGRDDGGRSVPSGVYFYRLETGHDAQTSRVVRVE